MTRMLYVASLLSLSVWATGGGHSSGHTHGNQSEGRGAALASAQDLEKLVGKDFLAYVSKDVCSNVPVVRNSASAKEMKTADEDISALLAKALRQSIAETPQAKSADVDKTKKRFKVTSSDKSSLGLEWVNEKFNETDVRPPVGALNLKVDFNSAIGGVKSVHLSCEALPGKGACYQDIDLCQSSQQVADAVQKQNSAVQESTQKENRNLSASLRDRLTRKADVLAGGADGFDLKAQSRPESLSPEVLRNRKASLEQSVQDLQAAQGRPGVSSEQQRQIANEIASLNRDIDSINEIEKAGGYKELRSEKISQIRAMATKLDSGDKAYSAKEQEALLAQADELEKQVRRAAALANGPQLTDERVKDTLAEASRSYENYAKRDVLKTVPHTVNGPVNFRGAGDLQATAYQRLSAAQKQEGLKMSPELAEAYTRIETGYLSPLTLGGKTTDAMRDEMVRRYNEFDRLLKKELKVREAEVADYKLRESWQRSQDAAAAERVAEERTRATRDQANKYFQQAVENSGSNWTPVDLLNEQERVRQLEKNRSR